MKVHQGAPSPGQRRKRKNQEEEVEKEEETTPKEGKEMETSTQQNATIVKKLQPIMHPIALSPRGSKQK